MIASIEKQEIRKRNNIVMTIVLQWRCVDVVFALLIKRYPYSIHDRHLTIAPTLSFHVILLPVRMRYEYDPFFLQYKVAVQIQSFFYLRFFYLFLVLLVVLLYEYGRFFSYSSCGTNATLRITSCDRSISCFSMFVRSIDLPHPLSLFPTLPAIDRSIYRSFLSLSLSLCNRSIYRFSLSLSRLVQSNVIFLPSHDQTIYHSLSLSPSLLLFRTIGSVLCIDNNNNNNNNNDNRHKKMN